MGISRAMIAVLSQLVLIVSTFLFVILLSDCEYVGVGNWNLVPWKWSLGQRRLVVM
jgi:hypothetical protein